jgi:predicted aldo/keto reductase-like oxidoreductase
MHYNLLGRTGVRISAVSLGTEYLINTPRDNVVAVVAAAVEAGVNYLDLFFAQARLRDDIGYAIRGERDRIMVAAHLGAAEQKGQYWLTRNLKVCEQYFLDFLKRLDIDYADVVFLHNCDKQRDYLRVMDGLLGTARRFQKEGKARFVGFSGHVAATALSAVSSGQIDVLLYPVNMSDTGVDAGELFSECVRRNVGLIAMKPFGGGKLLKKQTAGLDVTPVQCLSFALSQRGVASVLPGPRNTEELNGCLRVLEASDAEKDYSGALRGLKPDLKGACVYCNHCLPCPAGIDIGGTIRQWDVAGEPVAAAAACTACGACVERCPFGVDVVQIMRRATGTTRV